MEKPTGKSINQNPQPTPEGTHPFNSALDSVKQGKWNEMFAGPDPLVKHQQIFAKKRVSNGLIMMGILSFVGLTFFYTIKKMGQDDLLNEVDDRGYPKAKM